MLDKKLKVIVDFAVEDALLQGKTSFNLKVPDDFKATLYSNLKDLSTYLSEKGYGMNTNVPDVDAWHGWDIFPNRQEEFPDELASGKNHNKHQLMKATVNNITVKITLVKTN